ncbi:41601_t:CDS:2, partial [Gigaspora margarita]
VDNYALVLEYADGSSLKYYLTLNFKKMGVCNKVSFAWKITSGIRCLHEQGILHRDLIKCSEERFEKAPQPCNDIERLIEHIKSGNIFGLIDSINTFKYKNIKINLTLLDEKIEYDNMEIFKQIVTLITLHIMKGYKYTDGQDYNPLHHLCEIHILELISTRSLRLGTSISNLDALGMIDFSILNNMVIIDINTLNEMEMSPFFWVLHKKPLNKSLLIWLGNKGGRPVSEKKFCDYLMKTMLFEWELSDLESVAAKMFDYFWDCYDSKVVNEALKYAEDQKKKLSYRIEKKSETKTLGTRKKFNKFDSIMYTYKYHVRYYKIKNFKDKNLDKYGHGHQRVANDRENTG